MVIRTAQTSEKAAEGQEATLEFILVNHPLDCPVCDKGGECPLQDLTFRWGPGNTRMTFPKRTLEKPIPISPTIALDRERCILCYRCTRFSSDVAEDGQLVALNRGPQSRIVTALSGSETVEQAYALGRLLRAGLGAHSAVLPEETGLALDAYRLPLSAIRDAELVVILGDEPVAERAPVVDLWIRAARRKGARIEHAGDALEACRRLAGRDDELGGALRESERAILIWSSEEGAGGAHCAALARELGFGNKPGSGAFHLPKTPNGRGIADAWAAASDKESAN